MTPPNTPSPAPANAPAAAPSATPKAATARAPETTEAIDAVESQNNAKFEAALSRHDTADKLKHLATEIRSEQGRKEAMQLTIQQRHSLRKKVENMQRIDPLLPRDPDIFALTRPALDDMGSVIAEPAKKAGKTLMQWISKTEDIPYVGAFLSETRYFFGDTVPEATKNMGSFIAKWAEKIAYHVIANPLLIGFDTSKMPFLGGMVNYGRDQLKRIEAMELIESASADEKQDTKGKITFDKKGMREQWKLMSWVEKGITQNGQQPTQPPVDWYRETRKLIQARRAAKPDEDITFAMKDIRKELPSRETDEQKKLARTESAKRSWGVAAVEFTGAVTKAKKQGGNCTVSFPSTDSVNEDGTPKSPEALKLKEALAALNEAQEIEVSAAAEWEFKKAGAGVAARIPSAMDNGLFAPFNTLVALFKVQSFVPSLRLAPAGILPNNEPLAHFTVENNAAVLLCNGKTTPQMIAHLFQQQRTELESKAAGPAAKWRWNGTAWTSFTA